MIPADSKENIVTGRCSFRIRTRFLLTGVEEGIPLPLLFLVGSPDYSEVLEKLTPNTSRVIDLMA